MTRSPDPDRDVATEFSCPADAPTPVGVDAPIMEVMATMRAMRRLKPDPVPRQLLEELVRAATWAPSASNGQHYSFVVVTDRNQMAAMAEVWRSCLSTYEALADRITRPMVDEPTARMADAVRYQAEKFDDTPALIVACYDKSSIDPAAMLDMRANVKLARDLGGEAMRGLVSAARNSANIAEASSIYPAVQNLLLAARARGLGANVTVWHLFREKEVRRVLGVPRGVGIYALIPIGWPMGRFGPVRRRALDEVIHWDRW